MERDHCNVTTCVSTICLTHLILRYQELYSYIVIVKLSDQCKSLKNGNIQVSIYVMYIVQTVKCVHWMSAHLAVHASINLSQNLKSLS